jgi:hypothetical protein
VTWLYASAATVYSTVGARAVTDALLVRVPCKVFVHYCPEDALQRCRGKIAFVSALCAWEAGASVSAPPFVRVSRRVPHTET